MLAVVLAPPLANATGVPIEVAARHLLGTPLALALVEALDKLDRRALDEAVPVLDRREMAEQVLAAVVGLDEAGFCARELI